MVRFGRRSLSKVSQNYQVRLDEHNVSVLKMSRKVKHCASTFPEGGRKQTVSVG